MPLVAIGGVKASAAKGAVLSQSRLANTHPALSLSRGMELAVDGAARPAQKESRADDSKERPFPPLCRPAVPPRSPRSLSRVCLFLQAANGAACLQVRHLTPARRRTLLHRCRGFVLALHGLGFRSTLKIPNPRNRATLPCAQCPLVLMQCVPLPAALVPGWNKPVPRSGLGFRV